MVYKQERIMMILAAAALANVMTGCSEAQDSGLLGSKGDPCTQKSDCEAGLICGPEKTCMVDLGKAPAKVNESCADNICDTGLECNAATKMCEQKKAGLNEACDSSHPCSAGMICGSSNTCEQSASVTVGKGENCDSTHICDVIYYCDATGKCAERSEIVGEGQACDAQHLCGTGLLCTDGTCQKASAGTETVGKGSACDSLHLCGTGLECVGGRCQESSQAAVIVGEGESCNGTTLICQPDKGLACISAVCRHPDTVLDCGNGQQIDDYCSCSIGYVLGDDGKCNQCAAGYDDAGGKCIKAGTSGTECEAYFYYTNQWTNTQSGGAADFDVYLVGSFNGWKAPDDNYKMTYLGDGTHGIKIKIAAGDKYSYKFYVNGWEKDSWQSDPANGLFDDDGNNLADFASCGQVFGNNNGKRADAAEPSDECRTSFAYKNTNYKDKDVYLIGSFNDWTKDDASYKFVSDGTGSFTLSIDGKVNEKWKKGSSNIFKMYISGLEDSEAYRPTSVGVCTGENGNCEMSVSCGQSFMLDENTNTGGTSGGNAGGHEGGDANSSCLTTFVYTNIYTSKASGGEKDWDVYVVGDMNGWAAIDAAKTYKMKSDGRGTHTLQLALPRNTSYKYKFYVDGWGANAWKSDPNHTVDADGNNMASISQCGQTFKYAEVTSVSGDDPIAADGAVTLASVKNDNKNINIQVTLKDGYSITEVSGGSGKAVFEGASITDTVSKNSKYSYIVKVSNGTDNDELYVPVWVEDQKFDWHRALLYFAFTDRFLDGNNKNNDPKTDATHIGNSDARWLGGDFAGLQKKVEEGYFDKLGVNTLWISSVSMNTQKTSAGTGADTGHHYSAYHSYWPISTFMHEGNQGEFTGVQAIEPHFGTMDDLKSLVSACHDKGIRVLVDFAANHVHKDSPIFQKHQDWFNDTGRPRLCDDNGNWDNYSEKCWFSADLPDVNYENSAARSAMVKHAIWLIKNTDIDGFRVDAVKHMNIQFIKDLRRAVDALFANTGIMFYMVGETFTGDVNLLNKYIGDDLLHAQFDFPLYYKIGNILKGNGFYDIAHNAKSAFKSDLMGTFMGNHDVARSISVAANQDTGKWGNNATVTDSNAYLNMKTAWTILLTQPGVPLIYYGDEYGMPGANDPDNRRMMQFDGLNSEQASMLGFVQALGQARRNHPALSMGVRRDLKAENDVWCYEMSKDGETAVVALGHGGGGRCSLGGTKKLQNLLDPKAAPFDASEIDVTVNKLNVFLVK